MDTAVSRTNENSPPYVENTDPQARRRHGDMSAIPGWGADLDHANRPGYPMERTPPRLEGVHWDEPEQQHSHVKVFHSNERPGMTPVYGTSVPPRGLSGMLRSFAFRFSENDMRHWLVLLMADRVDMGEGILEDLAHGHIPNIFSEMGGPAEWRYNRAGFVRKALIVSTAVALAVYLLRRRNR
ncbi:MAG TPA: hypothetical protein VFE82_00400 [Ramlibacter sp.]|jgi:hypothetical protein|uniref:hypothetical protein n=1 Tax=Ramlibacter sp. TaxID=1917967 RepID=UPI002D51F85A|nr:hypothetical protein [Ramlibacter sp.]HZY16904.1 hypothetical protein [Ramlibacter sp.]